VLISLYYSNIRIFGRHNMAANSASRTSFGGYSADKISAANLPIGCGLGV